MKEKGPIRKTLETAGKVWTIATLPVEAYLVGHGLYAHKSGEVALGALGLVGDFFTWKWLNRDKQNIGRSISPEQLARIKYSAKEGRDYSPYSARITAAAA